MQIHWALMAEIANVTSAVVCSGKIIGVGSLLPQTLTHIPYMLFDSEWLPLACWQVVGDLL